MKKNALTFVVCLIVAVGVAAGGIYWSLSGSDPSPEAQVEQFVTRVLSAPDLGLESAYNEMFSASDAADFDPKVFDSDSYEASIRQAIADLLGEQASESMVESTLRGGAINSLQFEAARDNYIVVPKEVYVSVSSEEDQIYLFTVEVEVSAEDVPAFTATLPGRLQLDEDGLVRFIEVNYGAVTRGVMDARMSA